MKKRNYIYLLTSLLLLGTVTGCGTDVETKDAALNSGVVFAQNETKEETPSPTVTKAAAPTVTSVEKKEKAEKPTPEVLAKLNYFNHLLCRDSDSEPSVFWLDENTGISYFVNRESDYYIYQLKDGKAKLVVDIPAQELCMYDGLLYFMVENYDNRELVDIHLGDIYCYNPADNTVELVYEAGAMDEEGVYYKLKVNENGIYFSYYTKGEKTERGGILYDHSYHLPFGATEPVEDKLQLSRSGWENYELTYNPNTVLWSRTDVTDVKEFPFTSFRSCIVGDMFYSVSLGSPILSCINLRTGEESSYDFSKAVYQVHASVVTGETTLSKGLEVFSSFIVTENQIWANGPTWLYCMDLESGEINYYKLVDEDGRWVTIEVLYTDGVELYAEINPSHTGIAKKLVRIETDEISVTPMRGEFVMNIEEIVFE